MTAPNIPSVTRVTNARECAIASGFYLGDSTITNNLQWVRNGRADILSYVPKTVTDLGEADAKGSDTTETVPSDDAIHVGPSPPAEPAILRAIVRIDLADFWLTADGGYVGPNSIWKEMVDVKPSCAVTDPGIDPVTTDFPVVIQVLEQLTAKCVTPGYTSGKSFFSKTDTGATRFKLRHSLFQVNRWTVNVPHMCKVSEAFSFQLFPLTNEKNRAELLALKSTHRIVPLPAYDFSRNIIRPGAYRRLLQGAVVEVHFTLSHWGIATAKRDVYGGNIEKIRLLVLPTSSSSSKKRKVAFHLDSEDMPTQKSARM
ncbi:hypothetical protein EDD15DRAFT_2182600 [Pisolithus albus]|nr:hypothetical protein EDD15DRAFT_2182600 [Pisolithus albus]